MSRNRLFKNLVMLCIALLMVILAWGGLISNPATSQSSRVYNLEFDIRNIESRLNRVESQLNQRGGQSIRTPSTPVPSSSGRNRQRLSSDPMFDRLATLAIELRERIDRLDARVSKLESSRVRGNS